MSLVSQVWLDCSSHFHDFFTRLSQANDHDYEWCIDDLLIEVLKYIDHAPTAHTGIEMLGKDIALYREFFGTDTSVMAPAICWLAQTLWWELTSLGLYDALGCLRYEIGRDWPDNHTVVLLIAD